MASTATPVPSTAERIRTVCARAQALLVVDGAEQVVAPVCQLLPDGTIAIAVAADEAALAGIAAGQGMLELTDHAPLPLRERVRALVWVRGRLHLVPAEEIVDLLDRIAAEDPNPVLLQVQSPRSRPPRRGSGSDTAGYTLLRLTCESVVVADATGAESVGVPELLAARPDPLCAVEAHWLRHLAAAHPEVIARLAGRLSARTQRGPVHPLAVDRYGICLRFEAADGDHDMRLAFAEPVDDVAALNRAVRALLGCPFRNGLHARRD